MRATSRRDAHSDRARRWAISGTSGGTVWLTGLPAAGKSTIAAALEARLLDDAGAVAIVSLVSPYAADRQAAREVHDRAGLPFVEVFVDTPLAECIRRDPDRLYARAAAGELSHVTGVNDPYEPPVAPDLAIAPAGRELDELIAEVVQAMRSRGVGRD